MEYEKYPSTGLDPDSDWEFMLCLTHDVDRVRKTYQCLYYALIERDPSHLEPLLRGENPYWQFDSILALERDLGVRSSFYFLNEKSLLEDKGICDWIRPKAWSLYSYYNLTSKDVVDVLRRIEDAGWEVGLQGSYDSFREPDRLEQEKEVLDELTDGPVVGGRQHYLNMEFPNTWRTQRRVGLQYDSTLGSGTEFGFDYGYEVYHPFGGEFTVFPLTMMDQAVMASGDNVDDIKASCERVLQEAADNAAVMTIDWHQRTFDPNDFPGYGDVYEFVVHRALELGAWVGPVAEAYDHLIGDSCGVRSTGTGTEQL